MEREAPIFTRELTTGIKKPKAATPAILPGLNQTELSEMTSELTD